MEDKAAIEAQEEVKDNALHTKIGKWLNKQSEGMKIGEKYPYPDVVDLIFQYIKENTPSPVQGISKEGETVSMEEYNHAIEEIGQLQEQLKEAEDEIRDLQHQLQSGHSPF